MINQWVGQSTQVSGATMLTPGAEIAIYEGYNVGGSYTYAHVSNAVIDDVKAEINNRKNTMSIQATANFNSRLANTPVISTLDYTSPRAFYDSFDQTSLSGQWQASDDTLFGVSAASGYMYGLSTATSPAIFLTTFPAMKNGFVTLEWQRASGTAIAGERVRVGFRSSNITAHTGISEFVVATAAIDTFLSNLQYVGSNGSSVALSTSGVSYATGGKLMVGAYNNRTWGAYSASTFSPPGWLLTGASAVTMHGPSIAGLPYITHTGNLHLFTAFRAVEYGRVYTVGDIVRDIANNVNVPIDIPDYWNNNFSTTAGFTALGGTWFANASLNTLTGYGLSTARKWSTFFTGPSFDNFRFDIEMSVGPSSYAGPFIGVSGSAFTGIYAFGASSTNPLTILGRLSQEMLLPAGTGVTRYTTALAAPVEQIEYGTWRKYSLIKSGRQIRFLVDDMQVYYVSGESGYNGTSYNVIGFMLFSNNAGVSNTAQFRNLSVKRLSEVPDSFVVSPNSTLESAIERLKDITNFEIVQAGRTARVTFPRETGYSVVGTYNVGQSIPAWDIYMQHGSKPQNDTVVYGEDRKAWQIVGTSSLNSLGYWGRKLRSDESISDYSNLLSRVSDDNWKARRDSIFMSFESRANIGLEKHDIITVVDSALGISQDLIISNMNKNFNPDTADFTQTLTLRGV